MKIFLFGGARTKEDGHSDVEPLMKLIEKVIHELKPKQIFHVPFARTTISQIERADGRFAKHINLDGIEYLDANDEGALEKADSSVVFLSWGSKTSNLLKEIKANPALEQVIRNATYIISESAGSKVLWSYLRTEKDEMVEWLEVIKNTVIEPHYREKNRQALLEQEMEETHTKYGIGVDVETAMVFDVENFPEKYTVIGNGIVEVKTNNNF